MKHNSKDEQGEQQPVAEMQIDLGYADSDSDTEQNEPELTLDTIQTLSLDAMVIEDGTDPVDVLTDSVTMPEQTEAAAEAIVTLSEVVIDASKNLENGTTSSDATDLSQASVAPPTIDNLTPIDASQLAPKQPTPGTIDANVTLQPVANPSAPASGPSGTKPIKGENPFLPQHILDKLNQGRKDLADDIVQSSAALDVSTAILRTHARAERIGSPKSGINNNPFATKDRAAKEKQKLVDDLVDEYLPLVAAELRRRLHKLLND